MLCELLERQYFSGMGKYWAKEVSIDPWAEKGKPKRVDYMQFIPANQCSVSAIEKIVWRMTSFKVNCEIAIESSFSIIGR